MRLPSRRTALLLALSAVGVVNALLVLRPWAPAEVAATPVESASAPAQTDAASPGMQAYLSLGKSAMLSERDQREFRSGVMFMSYFLISTRGLAAGCETAGVDVSPYAKAFAEAHLAEYQQASERLTSHGLNADLVWAMLGDQLRKLTASHLDQYAKAGDGGHQDACRRIADAPVRFVELRGYRSNYPQLHAALMSDTLARPN